MICNLCGRDTKLVKGHIVPKFISRKLKSKEKSPYFRNFGKNPNIPLQDIEQHYLFCKDCDNKYSKYEKYFADNIFNKNGSMTVNIDYIDKFITFINYKIAISTVDEHKNTPNYEYLKIITDYLKEKLVNNKKDRLFNSYFINLLEPSKKFKDVFNSDVSEQIIFSPNCQISSILKNKQRCELFYNIYFNKAIEWSIYIIQETIYIFCKIPNLLIITTDAAVMFGKNTKINDISVIDFENQILCYNLFWKYYLLNLRKIFYNKKISDKQLHKIEMREFGKKLNADERKQKLLERYKL